jgi:Mg-chelatase subunit ChlD
VFESFSVLNTNLKPIHQKTKTPEIVEKLERWRLILGKKSDPEQDVPLDAEGTGMDNTLDALYDADRKGALGSSSPSINRWLGDIRKYFPTPVVQVMQKDALERLGLQRMLLEPELLETVEPDLHLVGTLLSLNNVLPAQTRETAKMVVRKVVDELMKKLKNPLLAAVSGALSRSVRNRRPKTNEIDWRNTILKNLKHYQPNHKTIIPEHLIGYGKKGQTLRHVILLMDQSGSMASSVVYSSVFAAVLASLRSVKTHFVAFDTAVVDLTDKLHDPVELLFGTQLGGGTDIAKALAYGQSLVQNPNNTIFVLISDLFEGGNRQKMLQTMQTLQQSGMTMVTLLALNDEGTPSYDHENAQILAEMGIPSFACTPTIFPDLMAAAIEKRDLKQWASVNMGK